MGMAEQREEMIRTILVEDSFRCSVVGHCGGEQRPGYTQDMTDRMRN